ncbi:hypothetical protein A2U01_0074744, partial [Trifolium medium]|nr:hypothetical protein [Trifolium medium]
SDAGRTCDYFGFDTGWGFAECYSGCAWCGAVIFGC